MVWPTENLKSVLEDLKSSLLKVGLDIFDRKCELYCPSGECCNFPTSVAYDGTIILGTPIGNSDFIRSQCIDIAKSGYRLCSELVKLKDSQSSMLILRHCMFLDWITWQDKYFLLICKQQQTYTII